MSTQLRHPTDARIVGRPGDHTDRVRINGVIVHADMAPQAVVRLYKIAEDAACRYIQDLPIEVVPRKSWPGRQYL